MLRQHGDQQHRSTTRISWPISTPTFEADKSAAKRSGEVAARAGRGEAEPVDQAEHQVIKIRKRRHHAIGRKSEVVGGEQPRAEQQQTGQTSKAQPFQQGHERERSPTTNATGAGRCV